MPIYTNDLKNSSIESVVTCTSPLAPCMVVHFFDGSAKMFEGESALPYIKKYTNSNNRSIPRTIGHELEIKLKKDFVFLFSPAHA